MTSKVRVKLGQLEVECEGTEDFLKDELPKLLETFSKLAPPVVSPHPLERSDVSTNNGDVALVNSTMPYFATKLDCTKGPELLLAAATWLTLVGKKVTYQRKELLDAMKEAKGTFKPAMVSNFTATVKALQASGALNEPAKGEYALTDAKLRELKAKLAA